MDSPSWRRPPVAASLTSPERRRASSPAGAFIIVVDVFTTRCLEEGELLVVAQRLRDFFTEQPAARK